MKLTRIMMIDESSQNFHLHLRTVRYVRHPGMGHGSPEQVENSLLVFVYDIPYFGACGIFPPLHLLNLLLLRGGSQGGMSPGATWEPFSLSPPEYNDLVNALRAVQANSLREKARYAHLTFAFDPDFDDLDDYFAWTRAVCARHREKWKAELKRAGITS